MQHSVRICSRSQSRHEPVNSKLVVLLIRGSLRAQCGATCQQYEARDKLHRHPGRHPASSRAALAWLRLRLWLRLL